LKTICCPRCDHAGPPGKDFPDQGLVECSSCGLLFEPGRKTILPEDSPPEPRAGKKKAAEADGLEEAGGRARVLEVTRKGTTTLLAAALYLPLGMWILYHGLWMGFRILQPDRLEAAHALMLLVIAGTVAMLVYYGAKLVALKLRAAAFYLLGWPTVVLAPHALLLPEWFEAEIPWEEIRVIHYTTRKAPRILLEVPRLQELRREQPLGAFDGLLRSFFGRGSDDTIALYTEGLDISGEILARAIEARAKQVLPG
jgi:hypothetical protein